MATNLVMVNNLRGKLREERIGTVVSPNDLTTELINLINQAAHYVLESIVWPFDIRRNTTMTFPGRVQGTAGTFTNSSNSFVLNSTASTDWDATEVYTFPGADVVVRVTVTNSDTNVNTSYRAVSGTISAPNLTLVMAREFEGTTISGSGTWDVYAYEKVLPTTVRKVLSVRNEEHPMQDIFVDRNTSFDSAVPRPHIQFDDRPYLVYVGGLITPTGDSAAGTAGDSLMIWPIPSSLVTLHATTVFRHTDLGVANDTDTFPGVDAVVNDLITDIAFAEALMSDIGNDIQRGQILSARAEQRLVALQRAVQRDPGPRKIAQQQGPGNVTGVPNATQDSDFPSP